MNSITQDILYKQSVVKSSYKYGVTKVAIKYKMHRETIYRWKKYYGTPEIEMMKDKEKKTLNYISFMFYIVSRIQRIERLILYASTTQYYFSNVELKIKNKNIDNKD